MLQEIIDLSNTIGSLSDSRQTLDEKSTLEMDSWIERTRALNETLVGISKEVDRSSGTFILKGDRI